MLFVAKHITAYTCRLALCVLFILLAKPASSQKIFFNKVQPPPGKSFHHVTGMVQDKQGYIWLATKNGLFKYDGYSMVHYRNNALDGSSIASDFLETICIDKNGIIWIGTFNSGLDRLDPVTGSFTHFRHDPANPNSLSGNSIFALLADSEGTLWIGANGLDRFNPSTNTFTHFRHKPDVYTSISNDAVRAIYEDKQGTLWVGTGSLYGDEGKNPQLGGLNKMDRKNGTFQRFMADPKNPTSLIANKVRAMFEDSKGNFWVGTDGDGLHTMNRSNGTFQRYPYDARHPYKLSRPALKKAPYYDHITFITEDATGAIWIGTAESGINYYDPKTAKMKHFESGNDSTGSFHDYTAWWAMRSREGVLWISTIHGSLYRINPLEGSIPFYPVPTRGVPAIFEDANKTLWLANGGNGLLQQNNDRQALQSYAHAPDNPKSISANEVSCISGDNNQQIWAGTFNNGLNLLHKDSGTFTRFIYNHDGPTGISNNHVISIYDDPGAYIWVGTVNGLGRYDPKANSWRTYLFYPPGEEENNRNIVTTILNDRHGNWWAGCWNKGGLQKFDPQTGKSKTHLAQANIEKVYEDHAGVLWAAALEGLYRYNREKDLFEKFEDPLFLYETNSISNLVEDDTGNLWLTTAAGIVRLNKERNETTLFGKAYGINGDEFYVLSGLKGHDNKLYFGTTTGYYAFYPGDLARGMRAPEIVLSEFRLANEVIEPGDRGILQEPLSSVSRIKLRYDQDVFSFAFAGIDYSNPEANRHLFMLENYDAGWNLAGPERKAIYFNVPPGKYVFKLKVVNSYGVWSTREIEIIITPPWWTTWWFRIGVVLLVAALFYTVVRWQVRQKFNHRLQQSEKDKQLAELRQKTGELEMQALRAQMNPHFVFNSLNAINRFILQNNKTQASEYLTKFSKLVRMILQNSQSTLITLESELESLKLYLELEALRFDYRFDYKVNVEKEIDVDLLKVPPLIIQPYAENAIWHGLMHKEEKGNLDIAIRQEDKQLVITIKDDGVGRKHASAMTSKSATKHKSMGLTITADRIAHMQRSPGVEPVIINDLLHEDGTAAGTEVIITIPVIYD